MDKRFREYGTFDGPTLPTNCCEFAVVDSKTGKEICRVWNREDAFNIAWLLNEQEFLANGED